MLEKYVIPFTYIGSPMHCCLLYNSRNHMMHLPWVSYPQLIVLLHDMGILQQISCTHPSVFPHTVVFRADFLWTIYPTILQQECSASPLYVHMYVCLCAGVFLPLIYSLFLHLYVWLSVSIFWICVCPSVLSSSPILVSLPLPFALFCLPVPLPRFKILCPCPGLWSLSHTLQSDRIFFVLPFCDSCWCQ